MLRLGICVAFCAVLVSVMADKTTEEEVVAQLTCDESDTLCSIRKQLLNVLDQLDKLAVEKDLEDGARKQNEMEKRKSAYVRFGKRTGMDDDISGVDKRKSAYVRFGRSVAHVENKQ